MTTNGATCKESNDSNFRLEDFESKVTLGTGTFGRVVLVFHPKTKKHYALKIMTMKQVIRLKQVEHVRNEKSILEHVSHPFLVQLHWSTKNASLLLMLLEFVEGGELFTYLRSEGRFPHNTVRFYSAEIVTALEYLHQKNIVYRDLKPENLLLSREGHLKLTDFGFAKKVHDRTWTLCGTPEYLAPEVINSKGHNKAVDWWALGILVYEMYCGWPPFYDEQPLKIYEKILNGKIDWPKHVDLVTKDLVKKLLAPDRTKRLGNMKDGTADVKRHRFFRGIDWQDVIDLKLKPPLKVELVGEGDPAMYIMYKDGSRWRPASPPIVPKFEKEGDNSNFDRYEEEDWQNTPPAAEEEQKLFEDF